MPAQQESMAIRMLRQSVFDGSCQRLHILRVLQDRHPFLVLMRSDTLQALEHLIALDVESASLSTVFRCQSAPNRVCVQDGSSAFDANDRKMEGDLFRGPSRTLNSSSILVHEYDFSLRQRLLVDTRLRDGQSKRFHGDHRAKV